MTAASVPLSTLFRVRRRYMRSVNLERDLADPKALEGYLPSPLAVDIADRFFSAWLTSGAHKAWTITGVYGTGKSAVSQFLCALASPANAPLRSVALRLLASSKTGSSLARRIKMQFAPGGIARAVVTARRESLAATVLRALDNGAARKTVETPRWKNAVGRDIRRHLDRALGGQAAPASLIIDLAKSFAESAGGLLLIVDELGKCLEHAARDLSGADDIYLLQQLAEASADSRRQFGIIGLLHQGFGEYGASLGHETRAEWLKVQGRFEDVVFAEPPEQTLQLIGRAIERTANGDLDRATRRLALGWHARLSGAGIDRYVSEVLTPQTIEAVLPLHPVAALVLPSLCAKYAQNDRSLFTFLAGQEVHAFGRFLRQSATTASSPLLPLQRVDDLYDYFAGIAGQALGFRPQFQRWAEIHAIVSDTRSLDADSVAAIKTIAALNLVASSGPLRASHFLTIAALCQNPKDGQERELWHRVVAGLVEKGLVTYRRQLDEYRLWEGSDFDVEAAIRSRASRAQVSLAKILTEAVALSPLVVQRHSYRTGTLRYFERRFVEEVAEVTKASCADRTSDGLLLYWVGRQPPPPIAATTSDGRPLVVVEASGIAALAEAAVEYAALEDIDRSESQLQTDGVARREVRHRLRLARALLDRFVRDAIFRGGQRCHVSGVPDVLSFTRLQNRLSEVCDLTYSRSPVLWNELINRRELTSQGAKARRELIEAMLRHGEEERLLLRGHGPETSMYAALLEQSGIHRREGSRWTFGTPHPDSGLTPLWAAVVAFCHGATASPRTIDELLALLEAPPYGVKNGVVPVILAAVLLADAETLTVYRDGTFLPTLGAEQFEILVKHPARFSVKHFALDGIRGEVFRILQDLVTAASPPVQTHRNSTILAVVRPLVRFATSLPPATLKTRQLSPVAISVREALLHAREPDALLFNDLPAACRISAIVLGSEDMSERAAEFRMTLVAALRELQTFHDERREHCGRLLAAAFIPSSSRERLRACLQLRVGALLNQPLEDRLRSFVNAAANDALPEKEWLEAVISVISERPLRTWTDEDATAFEPIVSDLARRFRNFEAVQSAALAADGTEVRRLSVTYGDGRDEHRLVWIPSSDRGTLGTTVRALAERLMPLSPAQREAVLALLAEALFTRESEPALSPAHAERSA